MKAITVQQPYASFIANGLKWVENRTKRHPWWNYRGLLAIHAGQGTRYMTAAAVAQMPHGIVAVGWLEAVLDLSELRKECRIPLRRESLVFGSIRTAKEILDHEHTEGPICLVLRTVRKLSSPIPCSGRLGLWDLPADVEAKVRKELGL